jgi:hypothetical protein
MKGPLNTTLFGIALASITCVALADDRQRQRTPFVGVLAGQVQEVRLDPERCPNPFQPVRVDVGGSAQTTLGRAQFTQSHCEDVDHTVFSDGKLSVSFDDGTRLTSTYQGSIFATPTTGIDSKLMINGKYRHTSGTGAPARAHGMGTYAGTVDVSTYAVVITLSGTL